MATAVSTTSPYDLVQLILPEPTEPSGLLFSPAGPPTPFLLTQRKTNANTHTQKLNNPKITLGLYSIAGRSAKIFQEVKEPEEQTEGQPTRRRDALGLYLARRQAIAAKMIAQSETTSTLLRPCRVKRGTEQHSTPRRLKHVIIADEDFPSQYVGERYYPIEVAREFDQWGEDWEQLLVEKARRNKKFSIRLFLAHHCFNMNELEGEDEYTSYEKNKNLYDAMSRAVVTAIAKAQTGARQQLRLGNVLPSRLSGKIKSEVIGRSATLPTDNGDQREKVAEPEPFPYTEEEVAIALKKVCRLRRPYPSIIETLKVGEKLLIKSGIWLMLTLFRWWASVVDDTMELTHFEMRRNGDAYVGSDLMINLLKVFAGNLSILRLPIECLARIPQVASHLNMQQLCFLRYSIYEEIPNTNTHPIKGVVTTLESLIAEKLCQFVMDQEGCRAFGQETKRALREASWDSGLFSRLHSVCVQNSGQESIRSINFPKFRSMSSATTVEGENGDQDAVPYTPSPSTVRKSQRSIALFSNRKKLTPIGQCPLNTYNKFERRQIGKKILTMIGLLPNAREEVLQRFVANGSLQELTMKSSTQSWWYVALGDCLLPQSLPRNEDLFLQFPSLIGAVKRPKDALIYQGRAEPSLVGEAIVWNLRELPLDADLTMLRPVHLANTMSKLNEDPRFLERRKEIDKVAIVKPPAVFDAMVAQEKAKVAQAKAKAQARKLPPLRRDTMPACVGDMFADFKCSISLPSSSSSSEGDAQAQSDTNRSPDTYRSPIDTRRPISSRPRSHDQLPSMSLSTSSLSRSGTTSYTSTTSASRSLSSATATTSSSTSSPSPSSGESDFELPLPSSQKRMCRRRSTLLNIDYPSPSTSSESEAGTLFEQRTHRETPQRGNRRHQIMKESPTKSEVSVETGRPYTPLIPVKSAASACYVSPDYRPHEKSCVLETSLPQHTSPMSRQFRGKSSLSSSSSPRSE